MPYFPRVRDRDDIGVLRCNRSGVIFIECSGHLSHDYYRSRDGASYWGAGSREEGLKKTIEDDQRRFEQFGALARGKSYLDVGCGLGGCLDLFRKETPHVYGIEPQAEMRQLLNALGHEVYSEIDQLNGKKFQVISLFHVFEHLAEPLSELVRIRDTLTTDGKIIIEVPHARDVLLSTFNLESFKRFTLWSEHLILHTRSSLEQFLVRAGFSEIFITGFQRYPLANHLHWLNAGEPGGQLILSHLRSPDLERAYAEHLNKIDQTDTLIAIASKASP